jgi:hypothetical protein
MTMDPIPAAPPPDGRQIILEEIRRKWSRLSEQDVSALTNSGDLVIQLQATYGLSKTYAQWDVDNFMKCRTL